MGSGLRTDPGHISDWDGVFFTLAAFGFASGSADANPCEGALVNVDQFHALQASEQALGFDFTVWLKTHKRPAMKPQRGRVLEVRLDGYDRELVDLLDAKASLEAKRPLNLHHRSGLWSGDVWPAFGPFGPFKSAPGDHNWTGNAGVALTLRFLVDSGSLTP